MPEVRFRVRWPNGAIQRCYSPSRVVKDHLAVGEAYRVEEFLDRARWALRLASRRVHERYGIVCSAALDQLAAIERAAEALEALDRAGTVQVLGCEGSLASNPSGSAPNPSREASRASEHFAVAIVGGGQAGLSMSYCLKERSIPHVVLEAFTRAHTWRTQRWDSFCLVTPNWQCRLPGHSYSGRDPNGFMSRDEVVAYLDAYADSFDPPLREGVRVESLESGEGAPRERRFVLGTSRGALTADQVVVATGGHERPRIPSMAAQLPPGVRQLHSSEYRRPDLLPAGEVLVVGTGQSGCQIAEDLHLAGRRVHLCVGSAPRCARRYRGRDVVEWLERMGHYDRSVEDHPEGERVRDHTNHYVTGRDGGRDIDLRRLALQGMRLYGPLRSITAERFEFAPGLRENLDGADAVYRRINCSIDAYVEKEGIDAPVEPEYVAPW
ncbi:MAG TPA: MSMEG_0570 family nitrogen starvation response protein, partial [Anaeromyxobacteraceae bacterium]|nr:MSMEG_0570 family nitrogen starvation response protein [Anaeromyxobacteraceae bacterium]